MEALREQLRQTELEEVLAGTVEEVTLHGITAEVEVEGVPVQALLDTGSPVTIVLLEFLISAIPDWKK